MDTHYPHRVASETGPGSSVGDAQTAGDGYAMRMFSWLRQAYCGLSGHDSLLQFKKDRIFLQCVSCGHETPGWELKESAPPIRVRGDVRRLGLMRPHLISKRRIA
jgi:hypothetical protein